MVAHLLWILVIYGLAAGFIHFLHALRHRKGSRARRSLMHYILITSNHERQVEWYLRALSLYALFSGTRVRVTVLDDRSEDDTMNIVQRLKNLSGIELYAGDWNTLECMNKKMHSKVLSIDERIIRLDLRISSEAARIPYVQG